MKKVIFIVISLWLNTTIFGNHAIIQSGITIKPASSVTISCTQDFFPQLEAWLASFGGASVISNDCDENDDIIWDYGPTNYESGCGGAETYTVTFIASNSCGDAIGTTASFIIEDKEAPVIQAAPNNVIYNCNNPIPPAKVLADCSEVNFTQTIDPYVEDYCHGFSVTYHWTATDACGNTSTLDKTYVVAGDNTPPTIVPRAGSPLQGIHNGEVMQIGCMDNIENWDPNAFRVSDVRVTDNCSSVEVSLQSSQMNQGDCTSIGYLSKWRHTWTATDACGNVATFFFITELVDHTPPTFSYVPADLSTNCHNIPPPEQAWAFDACTSVDISFAQTVQAGSCGGESTIIRTWTATDECGNATSAQQKIHIIDNTPPRIFIQDPDLVGLENGDVVELECESWNELYYGADAIFANDDCSARSNVQYDLQLEHFPSCNADGFFVRATSTWKASDECGNVSELVLYFLVGDHTPPVLVNLPAAICSPVLPPVANVTATDNCSDVEVTFEESDPQQGDDGTVFVERRWTAFDECGNADWGIQRITIEDRVNPVIRIVYPGLENIPLGGEATLPFDCNGDSFGVPIFTREDFDVSDNVGVQEVSWETTFIISGNCPRDNYLHKVVLSVTAIDKCGNFTRHSILLSIVDQTPPKFAHFSPTLTLSCSSPIPMLEATDDCGGPVDLTFVDNNAVDGACNGEAEALVRVWTATDQCGNTKKVTQRIFLVDNNGPVFPNFPADTCGIPAPAAATLFAIDECLNQVIPAELEQDTLQGPCGLTIKRTYKATDRCGNTTTQVQTIFETDTIPPVLTFVHPKLINLSPNATIEQNCVDFQGELYPEFGPQAVEVTDNCSDNLQLSLLVKLVAEGNCTTTDYLEKYRYTWQATDPCGNTSELSIFVLAVDLSPPVFAYYPRDTTIYCESPIPSPSDILVVDGCSDFSVDFTETIHTISPTLIQHRRKWKATDECGNSAEVNQKINISSIDINGTFTTMEPVVCGSANNNLGIQVSGGTAPYTYHWALIDSDATITAGQGTANITYTASNSPMNFVVKITDANQCLVMKYVYIGCNMGDGITTPPIEETNLTTANQLVTNFMLMPNPAANEAFVDINANGDEGAFISIQNIFGEKVYEKRLETIPNTPVRLPIANLLDGIYAITVRVDGQTPTTKQLLILQ
ncbi:MAG: T9SS type A sorting domain-containing protein [Saprospiraceae bacterium]